MIKPPLVTSIATLLSLIVVAPTLAAPPGVTFGSRSVATREEARRQERVERGKLAIDAGEMAMKEKDYALAYENFRVAADNIPNADASRGTYNQAVARLSDAAVKLAEQRITEGRFAEAERVLRTVYDRYNPKFKKGVQILSNLEDPDYYNRAITPQHRARTEEVRQNLISAEHNIQIGNFDRAQKRADQVLNIDPYNIAARKTHEKIDNRKDDYYVTAYSERRARAMAEVTKRWENPVRRFSTVTSSTPIRDTTVSRSASIQKKLQTIIIPKLEFNNATVREAIDYLRQRSQALDNNPDENGKKGVDFVLKLEGSGGGAAPDAAAAPAIPGIPGIPGMEAAPPAAVGGAGLGEAPVTIALQNIPLIEALKYVTSLANLKFKVEEYAVAIVPATENTQTMVTRQFNVPPGFIRRLDVPAADAGAGAGFGGGQAAASAPSITGRVDAREFLTSLGVNFPPNSTVTYLPSSSRLVVNSTQEVVDLIELFLEEGSRGQAAQVEIEAKFVEITQNNLKELSFDWLLGQANVGNGGVFFGGGTSGTSPTTSAADFGFVAPGGIPVGGSPVTGGNRSGNLAISANAIDSLLFGVAGNSRLAPGILSLAGVFTDPSFQVVVRALDQRKGVDLLSAPRVTTKSGQRAIIEIIREFRYPTEFEPPQIPQTFGNTGNQGGGGGGVTVGGSTTNSFPVTPTTPTAFETRNTGVTLEVEPQIGPDGLQIDLNLVPQVVEFEGFINYGSPIQSSSTNALGITTTNVITPNVINQPIFSTRKVTTSVSVFDGSTVVLGGLIREDVQKVEDKTPILGDIPLIGRAFRSNVDQHVKRNLVIFVTARLINAAGDPLKTDEDREDELEELPAPEVALPPLDFARGYSKDK